MTGARYGAVVVVALVLQLSLFGQFSYEGARPDVMILLGILAGYTFGPERGAQVGFAAGLAFDVVLHTPLGLSALVYCLVGYGAGATTGSLVRMGWWVAPAVAAIGSAAGMVIYTAVGEVLGEAPLSGPSLASILVIVSALNAVLAPVVSWVIGWAGTESSGPRHPLFFR